MAKRAKPQVHTGGRPANPVAKRMHVVIDPDVKRRVIIAAANLGIPFHKVLDLALRRYLDREGVQ
jgi:hypothetical protein